jgi:hypothetical protein
MATDWTPAEEIKHIHALASAILDHAVTLHVSKEELKGALLLAATAVDQSLTLDVMRATINNALHPRR